MKLAVLGCGKMGSALLGGMIGSGVVLPTDVFCYDPVKPAVDSLVQAHGVNGCASAAEAASGASLILVCVKPPDVVPLLREIAPGTEALVVSIAAGVALANLCAAAGDGSRVVRVMPNTPALVGAGATAYTLSATCQTSDQELVQRMFSSVGRAWKVPETWMDAVTGLSGSGPAYIYAIIEALADGGCLMGLPKAQSLELAAQTVMGAAQMVLESGTHPAVLRDQVTSPGGTTIAGLAALEKGGLRSALIEGVRAAALRSRELG